MLKTLITLLLFVFTTVSLQAQTVCKGTVVNVNKEAVANASVLIKNTDDNILQFGFTNAQGAFNITTETEGSFVVEVNKMGFNKQQQPLTITKDKKEYTFTFTLEESNEQLEDLVIEIDNPIQQRGDTLVYDAKAFSTGREVVVEDLLKNIPGITVEKDGKIKFEDTEIEKVMVDGDDFFNRGYSLLTKNMPNKPLDKVQVLRNYSNNKLLKGVEESNKVALNLTVDEAYKDLWFGDISAGYGLVSENRYDVSGNLMNFSKKYKNFLTYGLNNVGADRVGSLENMFNNNYEIESIGDASQLYTLMGLSGGSAGQLKDHRTRINNAEHVSLSTIVPVTNKLKVKLVGFLGGDESYAFNNRYSVTNVGETYFENSENNQYKSHLKTGYVNLLATYDVSATQMLQISSVYNQGNTNNTNDLTFNGTNTLEKLATKNTFFDQKLTYTHKWKDKNVVLLKGRFFSNKMPQIYHINDYLMGDLFAFDADAMNNDIKNNKTFAGLEADFKLKQKNDDLIEFQVGYTHNQQTMNTVLSLFDDAIAFHPNDFQTDSSFTLGDFYAKSGYTWKWKTFKVTGRAEAHQLFNQFTTLNSNKKQNPFYVNPSAFFTWDVTPTNVFSGSYMVNFNNTSFVDVNDTYLLTSSRSFSKGLGAFKLTDYQMANLGYSIRHYLNRYRFSFNLNYSKQSNVLSSRSLIEQNSSLSEKVFIKGGDTFGASFSSNFYFRKLKSNVKLEGSYSMSISFNEVNNSGLRKNNFNNQRYNFEWRTNFKIPFNFHIGTEWTFSEVKAPNYKNNYTNGFSFLDVFYKVDERIDVKAVTEYYYFDSLEKNQRHHAFLDVEATYKLKGDKWTLGLRGNNLLNKQNFTTYYVSDIGYSSTSYRLMPRFVLLSAKYRFSL
ncbi:carboxypeptidase regulatory-like domain-containing protein [Flavobacterium sp. xlx-214]|uniref:TonB-dependent receptor n=1 Tax=unclassified Flavobacterium TaxID=196869 RepID=UPI0013D13D46|nr:MULTISPECIES: TonB-dependent receptor [unclassified Flavobacterium]MBA5791576.1 carboxypeptidase regulatory-like domain-containing protein [Flavobacterium sp. xlx-221]QMI82825.1 carboxypeptidase regulatory-like domain-containing protein [Flavobacterium sp. xlx-214]